MRSSFILAGIAAAGFSALAASPASAQMYPPDVPVCIQVFGLGGNYTNCSYASIQQCEASASGRGAQCIENPYYVGRAAPEFRRERRYRRDY